MDNQVGHEWLNMQGFQCGIAAYVRKLHWLQRFWTANESFSGMSLCICTLRLSQMDAAVGCDKDIMSRRGL